jgi:tetratricopeptide (TPR) repeat protein
MSAPVPVRSKVAVTAIRGLIVGTTCSLALITEDRRRRISNAQHAIQNGDRIRSAKNYRAGGAELAIALEEDAVLFDPIQVKWTEAQLRGLGRTRERHDVEEHLLRQPLAKDFETQQAESVEPRKTEDVEIKQEQETRQHTAFARARRKRPISMIQPKTIVDPGIDMTVAKELLKDVSKAPEPSTTTTTSSLAFPEIDGITTLVEECARTRDLHQLDHAVMVVSQALTLKAGRGGLAETLLNTCALLVRTCQEMGKFNAAADILRAVVQCGQLKESDYYDFRPLELLDGLILSELSGNGSDGRVDARRLGLAAEIYLARFRDEPIVRTEQGFTVGKRLLELSFTAKKMDNFGQIEQLYWRCLLHRQNDFEFTQWFITQLHGKGEFKAAVRYFLLAYSKMAPSQASIVETGDVVVASVTAAKSTKAGKVLQKLAKLCSPSSQLKSVWVAELLQCDWERGQSFDKTVDLFSSIRDSSLQNVVPLADVYRVMMEISLKAGRQQMLDSYVQVAIETFPEFAFDARVIGILALAKAQLGDWRGVEQDFLSLQTQVTNKDDIGPAFLPVLEVYAQSHTIHETESFLRHYVDHVGVPICTQIAAFMAKQYAAVRDSESLTSWLGDCARAGVPVDAAFSNAVLAACRTYKMPFKELRSLFQKIKSSGGGFTDGSTERIMLEAALVQSKRQREPAAFRIKSAKVKTHKAQCLQGKCYSEQDVLLSMKERLAVPRPLQALKIYRRALDNGLDLPDEAHRLAVKATLAQGGGNTDAAYAILATAQSRGRDVSTWAMPILTEQLSHIHPDMYKEEIRVAIQKILDALVQNRIRITEAMLNQTAYACLQAKYARLAIKYATMAAETYGKPLNGPRGKSPELCYNMYNFSVLVQAFAHIEDVEMLRYTIDQAKTRLYWTESLCRKALKLARQALNYKHSTPIVEEAKEIIAQALEETKAKRQDLAEERTELKSTLFDILQKAATEANSRSKGMDTETQSSAVSYVQEHVEGPASGDEFERRTTEAAAASG